ncbi:MAG: hypothetical protein RL060_1382, partial [Bacteroidota bacterium]
MKKIVHTASHQLVSYILLFFLFNSHFVIGQTIPDYSKNCPDVPCRYQIDTNAFLSTEGEIRLGSGIISKNNAGSGNYNLWTTLDWRVPCNKPTFAIAMAHGWMLFKNMITPDIDINIFAATLINETSGGACIPPNKIDMSCYTKTPENFPFQNEFIDYISDHGGAASSDGCFQIDVLGRATLNEWLGSTACGIFQDPAKNTQMITRESFETGLISKFYYGLILTRRFYSKGNDPFPVLKA